MNGSPGNDAPINLIGLPSIFDFIVCMCHIAGIPFFKCGSPAKIDLPDFVCFPEITQQFDPAIPSRPLKGLIIF